MYYFLLFYIFLIGLVIGSFLNVVIYRLPLEENENRKLKALAYPPSSCPRCKKRIKWYDNIPILSWIFLKGKCRYCNSKISIRYPLVELLTGLIFLSCFIYFDIFSYDAVFYSIFLTSLLAVTLIDLDTMTIPDELSLGVAFFGLATSYFASLGFMNSLIGAVSGFLFFFIVAYLFEKFRGIEGLGGGDIKLMASVGAFTGPIGVFVTILLGTFLALIFNFRKKGEFPFGPFLAFGATVSVFFRNEIFDFYIHLFK